MFRFNNPDALLVLLLVAGGVRHGAGGRDGEHPLAGPGRRAGRLRLPDQDAAGAARGAGASRSSTWWPRRRRCASGSVTLLAAGGALLRVGRLVGRDRRAGARPRRGPTSAARSTTAILELVLGYNGLGRLTGNETGSVGGGGAAGPGGGWGATGWARLFNAEIGGQVAWLLPAALILLVAGARGDRPRAADRPDPRRAAAVGRLAAGHRAVFSFMQGIFHAYYTVALAPAIGALVGIGAVVLWRRRRGAGGRRGARADRVP